MDFQSSTRRNFLQSTAAALAAAAIASTASTTSADSPSRKIRYALVGLGNLNLGQILPAFAECQTSMPTALVSGHPDKAAQTAAKYHIDPKSIYNYDTYDRINDNPDIDAVIIALPNSMHAEYTIRAARAGKHVRSEEHTSELQPHS